MDSWKTDIKIEDELHLAQDRIIAKQLGSDESILQCSKINKYNNQGVVQHRIILITTHYIYNLAYEGFFVKLLRALNSQSINKRKIPIESVSAFTVSCDPESSQFVIHVERQHDYRYTGGEKLRESVIYAICMAFRLKTGRKFPFHFKEDGDLAYYQTHENDVKTHVNKRPRDAAYLISDLELSLGLNFFIKGRKDLTKDDRVVRRSLQQNESVFGRSPVGGSKANEDFLVSDRDQAEEKKSELNQEEEQFVNHQTEYYNEKGSNYTTIPVTTSVMVKK